jgi:ABC-2 type transport system ATP-binding protein
MTQPVIVVRDLVKTYGGNAVVDGLSFEVLGGSVTAFLGPNGAGKTTTIRALLGLVHPDSGQATVFGQRFTQLADPMTRVGVLIDGSGFHPLRTARNHLRMLAAAARIPAARVDRVLDIVELSADADRKVGGFSLGMRQRLGLATALLGDPDLLILDEPANGLDPAGIRWLRSFLESFAASGRTVLVSSHVLSEVALVADDVVVINHGRLVQQTAVHDLTVGTRVTVRSPDMDRLRRALLAHGASVTELDEPGRLDVTGLSVVDVGELAAREHAVLHELSTHTSSLEDIFLELTAKETSDASAA